MVIRRGLARAVTLLVATLLLVGVSATPALASSSSEFAAKINAARSSHGERALVVKADLNAAAQAQAERMADRSDLFHNPNLGGSVSHWSMLAENVGYGPNVATIHTAFMNSSGHRGNILNGKYTEVGVGVVVRNHVMWVAEVFRRPAGNVGNSGAGGSPKAKAPAIKKPATPAKKTSTVKQPAAKKPQAKQPVARKPATKSPAVAAASARVVPAAALRADAAQSARGWAPMNQMTAGVPPSAPSDVPLPAAVTIGMLALMILGCAARLRLS